VTAASFETVLARVTGSTPPGSPSWCLMARAVVRVAAELDADAHAALSALAESDPETVVLALAGPEFGREPQDEHEQRRMTVLAARQAR
jgi:hypothetical protein